MSRSNEQNVDEKLDKLIDAMTQELYGSDEAGISAELVWAEKEVQRERDENPEEAENREAQLDQCFEELQQLIGRREPDGIHLIEGADGEAEGTADVEGVSGEEDGRKIPKISMVSNSKSIRGVSLRGRKKTLVLAAAVCLMGIGMTMGVTATSKYELKQYQVLDEQMKMMNRNVDFPVMKTGELRDAYVQIKQELNIPVLVLGDLPEEMQFQGFFIAEEYAVLEFAYKEKLIYFEQSKMLNSEGKSGMIVSDRKVCEEINNFWLNKTIQIEQNVLKDGFTEYSAQIELDGSYYYLSGIMEKEEFVNLVEQINNY